MRAVMAAGLGVFLLCGLTASADKRPAPKPGIKTPGVQIPFENLKSLAEIPAPGISGPLAIGDAIWFAVPAGNNVGKIDAKTNKTVDPVAGFHQPCSGLIVGFGSVLVPNCGDQTLARIDVKTGKVTATLPIGAAKAHAPVAVSADSIWMFTDGKTTLSRVDPVENKVVSEIRLPAGCDSALFGEAALWVACPGENRVLRIDSLTGLVVNRIEVAAKPHALAAGENSIWVLCQADGKVARIDPKTNKVSATIDLAVPDAEGSIAFGEGFVWVSMAGFPISRIDPQTDKVVQQFAGDGGREIAFGLGSIWLSDSQRGTIKRIDPKRVIATLAE